MRCGRDQLLDALNRLVPSEFETVLFRLQLAEHHLPPASQPQGLRAKVVIELLEREGRLGELNRAITRVTRHSSGTYMRAPWRMLLAGVVVAVALCGGGLLIWRVASSPLPQSAPSPAAPVDAAVPAKDFSSASTRSEPPPGPPSHMPRRRRRTFGGALPAANAAYQLDLTRAELDKDVAWVCLDAANAGALGVQPKCVLDGNPSDVRPATCRRSDAKWSEPLVPPVTWRTTSCP